MEIELQYLYRGDRNAMIPVELADFVLAESESFDVLDTYYDTDRLDLRRAGCSLRVRQAGNLSHPHLVWKGRSERRPDGAKQRQEVDVPLAEVPSDGRNLQSILGRYRLWEPVTAAAGLDDAPDLHVIGQLRNARSSHVYVQGLHRLELTWDRLEFPVGPPEARIEVEVKSQSAARYLAEADRQLRDLFGADLVPAVRGKSRELCTRLYPELVPA